MQTLMQQLLTVIESNFLGERDYSKSSHAELCEPGSWKQEKNVSATAL